MKAHAMRSAGSSRVLLLALVAGLALAHSAMAFNVTVNFQRMNAPATTNFAGMGTVTVQGYAPIPNGPVTFDVGTNPFSVQAVAGAGWTFDRFQVGATVYANGATIPALTADATLDAYFYSSISVSGTTTYRTNIAPGQLDPTAGSVAVTPGGSYKPGAQVTITATPTPNARFVFSHFIITVGGTSTQYNTNPLTYTVDTNMTYPTRQFAIAAYFTHTPVILNTRAYNLTDANYTGPPSPAATVTPWNPPSVNLANVTPGAVVRVTVDVSKDWRWTSRTATSNSGAGAGFFTPTVAFVSQTPTNGSPNIVQIVYDVTVLDDMTFRAELVRASSLVWIPHWRTGLTAMTQRINENILCNVVTPVFSQTRYSSPFEPRGVCAQLQYSDGTGVSNPSTDVVIDLSRPSTANDGTGPGAPGAYLSGTVAKPPTSVAMPSGPGGTAYLGGVEFDDLKLDRVGDRFRLLTRYDFSYTSEDGTATSRNLIVIPTDTDPFDIVADGGYVMATGYNYFGQLGRVGQTGVTGTPGYSPIVVSNPVSDHRGSTAFQLDYAGDAGRSRYWPHFAWGGPGYGNNGWPQWVGLMAAPDQSWWARTWYYSWPYFTQGSDHYEFSAIDAHTISATQEQWQDFMFQAVAAGQFHSMGLRSDGMLMTWGMNDKGQLGTNTTDIYGIDQPTLVTKNDLNSALWFSNSAGRVVGISAGLSHSVALRDDGTVWATGDNTYGQLGDGTTNKSSVFLQVVDPNDPTGFLTNIVAISAGDYHTLALKKDGSVWGWGYNGDGELGDGSTTNRLTPVQCYGDGFGRLDLTDRAHAFPVNAVAHILHGGVDYYGVGYASGNDSQQAYIYAYDAAGTRYSTLLQDGSHFHTSNVNAVVFVQFNNALYAVTAGSDGLVKLWEITLGGVPTTLTGTWKADLLDGGRSPAAVRGIVAYSAGPAAADILIAAASVDHVVQVWKTDGTQAGSVIQKTLVDPADADAKAHSRSANAVRFNTASVTFGGTPYAAGALVFSASSDKTVKMWDWATGVNGTLLATLNGHTDSVMALDFAVDPTSGNAPRLVSAGVDQAALLWNPAAPGAPLRTFQSFNGGYVDGHKETITSLALGVDDPSAPTQFLLVTASKDMTVKRWDVATGQLAASLLDTLWPARTDSTIERHTDWVNAVCLKNGNANWIMSGSQDTMTFVGSTPSVVAIEAGGFHNLALTADGQVWAWGLNTDRQIGDGSTSRYADRPTRVKGPDGVGYLTRMKMVSASDAHSLAADFDAGTVWAWGKNNFGQCYGVSAGQPNAALTPQPYPVYVIQKGTVNPLVDIQTVSAGWGFSLARDNVTGKLWGWGHNHHGQLGNDRGLFSGGWTNDPQYYDETTGAIAVTTYSHPSTLNPTRAARSVKWEQYDFNDPFGDHWNNVENSATVVQQWVPDLPNQSVAAGYWHSLGIVNTSRYRTKLYWSVDPPGAGTVIENLTPLGSSTGTTSLPQTGVPQQTEWINTSADSGRIVMDKGTRVRVKAVARPGYRFDHWSQYFVGINDTQAHTGDQFDHTVTAHFTVFRQQIELRINVSPAGSGTTTGAGTYNEGDEAVIQANANAGYAFNGWTSSDVTDVDGSMVNPETVRMSGIRRTIVYVTANFKVRQHTLTARIATDGILDDTTGGSVNLNPAGGLYNYGVKVDATALPNTSFRFVNWTGDLGGSTNPGSVTMDRDKSITANFIRQYLITTPISPAGAGAVTNNSPYAPWVDKGSGCTLTASGNAPWRFDKWTGADVPAGKEKNNPLVFAAGSITKDLNLQANFVRDNNLTISPNIAGSATWTQVPMKGSYVTGESVEVTLTPAYGFRFLTWTGGYTSTSPKITVVMNGDVSLTAVMAPMSTYAGQVLSWGYNLYGALGNNDPTHANQREPVFVDNTLAHHVKRLGAGAYHSLAVKADGSVIAWGANGKGQVGDNSTTDRDVPVPVNGQLNWPTNRVRAVAGGDYHSLALRDDGFVFAWGQGLYGQLGNNSTLDRTAPGSVPGLNSIVAIAAGAYHTLALRSDGTVWACGLNNRGQLGDGTVVNRMQVTPVVDPMDPTMTGLLQNVVAIAAGDNHSVALKGDGTVWAWGANNWGQLGDGTTTDSVFPVQVLSGGAPLLNVKRIACGSFHTLALVETGVVTVNGKDYSVGTVKAWGWNLFGQLGYNNAADHSPVPVDVVTAGGALDNIVIDANNDTTLGGGYAYSMALRLHVNNAVNPPVVTQIPWTWGRNLVGELGNGGQADSRLAVQVSNANDIRSIAAGRYHGLAMVNPVPHKITGAMTPVAGGLSIVASGLDGKGHTVAPVAVGKEPDFDELEYVKVVATPQPGYRFDIWTGDLTSQTDTDYLTLDADKSVTANFILDPLLYRLTILKNGSGTATAGPPDPDLAPDMYKAGTVVTLTAVADPGFTFSGWTGDVVSLSPVVTITMSVHRTVTANFSPTASFRTITTQSTPVAGGTVTGGGDYPLNGTTTLTATANPGYRFYYWEVDGLADISDNANPRTVLVDNNHTFTAHFVLSSGNPGTLFGWGSNAYGQVGDGSNPVTVPFRLQPSAIAPPPTDVAQLSAGQYHVLALRSDGVVYAWGDNANGQLGRDWTATPFSNVPVQVTFPGLPVNRRIARVAAGGQFSVAVDTAGNVWTWGDNTYGQLGDNSQVTRFTPVQIPGISGVEDIAAGENHVLALLSDDTVWAWGYNLRGQLGVGDANDRWIPTQVVDLTDPTGFLTGVSDLSAGAMHSLALKDDGSLMAWGFNGDGQLGNNTIDDSAEPVLVLGGLPRVTEIASGAYHNLAVDANGNVWSWGYNATGQLGYGNNQSTDAGVPAKVKDSTDPSGFLTGIVSVSGGYAHSAAIRSDSGIRAWGDNTWGQLGNGDVQRLPRTLPVQVMQAPGVPLTDIGGVAAGWTHTIAEINPVYFRLITHDDTADRGHVTGAGTYVRGAIVDLDAIEYAGGQFQRWEAVPALPGSPNLTAPRLTVTMDQDYDVTGHFIRNVANSYKLRVNLSPAISPTNVVKVDPAATPGVDAQGPYYLYTFSPATVTIDDAAARALGYTFNRWQGPITPTADPLTCKVLLEPQKTLPANDITISAIFDLLCDLNVASTLPDGTPLPGTVVDSAVHPGITPYSFLAQREGTTIDLQVNAASKRRTVAGATYDFFWWDVNGALYYSDKVTFPISAQPTNAVAVYKRLRSFSVQSLGVAGVAITSAPVGYGGSTPYPPPTINVYDGDAFTLTAPATWPAVNPTHNFQRWRLNGVDQAAGQMVLPVGPVSGDVAAVAVYVPRRVLTVQSAPLGNVVITSTTGQGGTTDATTREYAAVASDQALLDLTAPPSLPGPGGSTYDFIRWYWNGVGQTVGVQTLFKTISKDSTAQAVYGLRRVLTVQSTGGGAAMPGVAITSTTGHGGVTNYTVNTIDQYTVALTAPPTFVAAGNVDFTFDQWVVTGAVPVVSPTGRTVTFDIGADVSAVAQYVYVQRTLSVIATSSGVQIPAPIGGQPASAGGTTKYTVLLNDEQNVTLTAPLEFTDAATQKTYSFLRWRLNGVSRPDGVPDVNFTMSGRNDAEAVYTAKLWSVDVQSTPIKSVPISGAPSGTTDYIATKADSTTLTLTAPATRTVSSVLYAFQKWTVGGVDQPQGQTTYSTTIRSSIAALATYAVVPHTVAVRSEGLAGVPVQVTGGGTVNTPADVPVDDNADLTLTVVNTSGTDPAGTDFVFERWVLNGANQTKGKTDLTISKVKVDTHVAVAKYVIVQRGLSVDSQPARGVVVKVNGADQTTRYPSSGTVNVNDNTALTLVAPQNVNVSNVDYVFNVWTVNGVDQTPGVLTYDNGGKPIKTDIAAVAKYNYVQRGIQIQSTGNGAAMPGVDIVVSRGWSGTVTTDTTLNVNDNINLTFTAPATKVSGGVTYYFKRWTLDGNNQPFGQRALALDNIKTGHTAVAVYGDDNGAPVATLEQPRTALQVARDTILQVLVTDAKSGVDFATVVITANGSVIYNGAAETSLGVYDSTTFAQPIKGVCRRIAGPTANDWRFVFENAGRFDFDQTIAVVVNAEDKQGTPINPAYQKQFVTVMRSFGPGGRVNSDVSTLAHDHAAVATDGAGNQWVIWDQVGAAGDTDLYFGIRPAGQSGFGASTRAIVNPFNQRHPAIAFSSKDGRVYIAWQDDRLGQWDVRAAYTTNGVTWTESLVAGGNAAQTRPAIGVDGNGKVYVAWEDDTSGVRNIRVASSVNGTTWVNIVAPALAFEQKEPCMAVNRATNNVFVLWTDSRNVGPGKGTEVWGFSNGNGWTGLPIAVDAKGQNSPTVAVEQATDNLHMAWTSAAPGNFDIFYATSLGLPLAPLAGTNVTQDPAAQTLPSIAVNGLGADAQIYLVWQDARQPTAAGETDIYFADIRPGVPPATVPPWTNILVNPDAPATSVQTSPRVGLDDAARPLVVWTDTRLGGLNIFAAGATMAGPNIASNKTPVDHTKAAIRQVQGAPIGKDGVINGPDDVLIEIPANAMPQDAVISISKVANPPKGPTGAFGAAYEFGASGLEFNPPVTVYLPHAAAACPLNTSYQVYYYDPLDLASPTYPWSQKGITNVQHIVLSPTLHAIKFNTTHFSTYTAAGTGSPAPAPTPSGGGGGGGMSGLTWCFIATSAYDGARMTPENLDHLNRLRAFRRDVLLPTELGRRATSWYSAVSPPLAERIEQSSAARLAVRHLFVNPLAQAVGGIMEEAR